MKKLINFVKDTYNSIFDKYAKTERGINGKFQRYVSEREQKYEKANDLYTEHLGKQKRRVSSKTLLEAELKTAFDIFDKIQDEDERQLQEKEIRKINKDLEKLEKETLEYNDILNQIENNRNECLELYKTALEDYENSLLKLQMSKIKIDLGKQNDPYLKQNSDIVDAKKSIEELEDLANGVDILYKQSDEQKLKEINERHATKEDLNDIRNKLK